MSDDHQVYQINRSKIGDTLKNRDTIPWEKIQHYRFIELVLYYCGVVYHEDLVSAFHITASMAAAEFSEFATYYPESTFTVLRDRPGYLLSNDIFISQFSDLTSREYLSLISSNQLTLWSGISGAAVVINTGGIAIPFRYPDRAILAGISRAIRQDKSAIIHYQSLGQTPTVKARRIKPHALAFNGQRWHVRAYDVSRERFSDFVLLRVQNVVVVESEQDDMRSTQDTEWYERITIELIPHPGLSDERRQVVIQDYEFDDKQMLRIKVRKALAAYLLLSMDVDYSSDYIFNPKRHHLALRNHNDVARYIGWLLNKQQD